MPSSQHLNLATEQRLQQNLSPLQLRYLKILEMPDAAVEEAVRNAVDENPALEIVDPDNGSSDAFDETPEQLQLADYRNEEEIPHLHPRAGATASDSRGFSQPAAPEGSLMDLLLQQLGLVDGLSPDDRAIGRYIIGNIDSNGYLTRLPHLLADDISVALGREVSAENVRQVLDIVRRFDPAGVGASDLRNCLLLQLRRKPASEPVADAIVIVRDLFDLFSRRHFNRIISATGFSRERLRCAVDTIRTLNPKPGSEVSGDVASDRMRHVSPDFLVDITPDGDLTLSLLSHIPELAIESTFADDAKPLRKSPADDASAFIRARREEALGFIKILKMRSQTLFRVMSAILKIQRSFFLSGNEADIVPMILKDISALTGDNLSVISRATQGKYVATPWGIFPLKHFFNEKFRAEGTDTSSRTIMLALSELIDGEDKQSPLSDEALAARLKEMGMDVARRTVAKYREQMSIPVARMRRSL